jgi:hypothetical protein
LTLLRSEHLNRRQLRRLADRVEVDRPTHQVPLQWLVECETDGDRARAQQSIGWRLD